MSRFSSCFERSFLTDVINRKTENEYLYIHQSCHNIAEDFLRIKRDWDQRNSEVKYNLSSTEKIVLNAERAILKSGFSHGEKTSLIFLFTGIDGDRLTNLLEKITAKLFISEYFFGKPFVHEEYLFEDLLELFVKKIKII